MTAVFHASVVAVTGLLLLVEYRALRRQVPLAGAVFGLGVALRCLFGAALFLISFLNEPILRSLQLGGGFWRLAPDARVYFTSAYAAFQGGLGSISSATPSPAYVRALAIWFSLAGGSPATAVLFNVVCFAATALALVGLARSSVKGGTVLCLAAIAFAPVLVLSSTQVLKDGFFELLLVVAFVAAACGSAALHHRISRARVVAATAAMAASIALLAGVRAYFAAILWFACALALLVGVVQAGRPRLKVWGTTAGLVVVLWIAFGLGAADYYPYYSGLAYRATGVAFPPLPGTSGPALPPALSDGERSVEGMGDTLIVLRHGFVSSGGATNLAGSARELSSGAIIDTLMGLLAMTVPISVLKWLSVVSFAGGRGFLLLTDLDTVFMDALMAATVVNLYRNRSRLREHLPFLTFAAVIALSCGLLLGYVVTNYGTLFRLRLMFSTPIWLSSYGLSFSQSERPNMTSPAHL